MNSDALIANNTPDRIAPPISSLNRSKLFILVNFLLFTIPKANAQPAMNYAVHANIIYRFTKYIEWPNNKKAGDFIIGIVGDSPLYDELRTFIADDKTVGAQKIVIKRFSSSAGNYNCHILFISEGESGSLQKVAARTNGTSTLLVSESPGLASKGSCVNFIIANERLKLEINKNNIEHRNMRIASELLRLGTIIR